MLFFHAPFWHFGPPPPHHPHFFLAGLLLAAALFLFARARLRYAGDGPRGPLGFSGFCKRGEGGSSSGTGAARTGNAAFDDYKRETIAGLEREAAEFSAYLTRLRHAADRADFERFVAARRADKPDPGTTTK